MTDEEQREILAGGVAMMFLAKGGCTYERMIAELCKEKNDPIRAAEYIAVMEDGLGFRFTREVANA